MSKKVHMLLYTCNYTEFSNITMALNADIEMFYHNIETDTICVIYAWTTSKEYINQFVLDRNISSTKLRYKKIKMDKEEFESFRRKFRGPEIELHEITIFNKNRDSLELSHVLITRDEHNGIITDIESIYDELMTTVSNTDISLSILESLRPKYYNALDKMHIIYEYMVRGLPFSSDEEYIDKRDVMIDNSAYGYHMENYNIQTSIKISEKDLLIRLTGAVFGKEYQNANPTEVYRRLMYERPRND